MQVLIIFLGGRPFHIVKQGLTGIQWGICIGFSAITFVISIIIKTIPLDILLDKFISIKDKKRDIDPIAPEITNESQMISIQVDENKNINNENDTEDDNEDIISEKVNINILNYDFNNIGKKKENLIEEKNDKISSQSILLKDHETDIDKDNNNNFHTNENNEINNYENENEISNKIEEISKKYKITNNIMHLPENYSTDDEDEYKFINYMNESNDSYEKVIDSKKIKIFAKIVSLKIFNNKKYFLFINYRLIMFN